MTSKNTPDYASNAMKKAEQNIDQVNDLLDGVIKQLHLKNDAALSRKLVVAPPVISKLRHGRLPLGDTIIIRLSEVSGISATELRDRVGLPRYTKAD